MTEPFADLSDKVAIVTGGTSGLGAGFSEALAREGASVAVVGRSKDRAEAIVNRISSSGGRAVALLADIRSRVEVSAMVARASEELGPIDILVNSAGVSHHAHAADTEWSDWEHVLGVNLNGLWSCTQAVASTMIAAHRAGSIVNIGSISGLIVNRPFMQPAYNSAKAAVHHLTRSLAAEWAPYGIRVNAIAPGFVRTEMTRMAEAEFADSPDFKRYTVDDVPMGRYATIDEVTPALLFLCSGRCSSYVTGSIIVVDGGYTLW